MNNDTGKLPNISKFGLASVLVFIIFVFIGQLLFPLGDEPDFIVRAPQIVYRYSSLSVWTPYHFLGRLLSEIRIDSSCLIDSSVFSLWAYINRATCFQGLENTLYRGLLNVIVTLPLLIIIIFRRQFVIIAKLIGVKIGVDEWNIRLNALSISLLFPSMIYYLGVLSFEQWTLVISLLMIMLVESIVGLLFFLYLVFLLDTGGSVVLIVFFALSYIYKYLISFIGLSRLFLLSIILLITVYLLNITVLGRLLQYNLFVIQRLLDEANNTYLAVISSGLIQKYPIVLRPVITYMSMIFLTPSALKSVALYVITGGLIIFSSYRLYREYQRQVLATPLFSPQHNKMDRMKKDIVYALAAITTILLFVFILPTYANAKYYIFLLPIFIRVALNVFSKWAVLRVVSVLSIILFINLMLMMI